MATHSNGISALQLQKQLGLGSYRTAWMLCAKLRRAMVAPGRDPLSGLVEVDETNLPCRSRNEPLGGGGGRGRGAGEGTGAYPSVRHRGFLGRQPAWFSARRRRPAPIAPGVSHDPHVIGPMAAHIVLPWVHRVFSNLKTWALGVYHSLRRKNIQTDLDEFVFRFNRRRTRHAAFRTLLGIGVVTKPVTYKTLIAPEARA